MKIKITEVDAVGVEVNSFETEITSTELVDGYHDILRNRFYITADDNKLLLAKFKIFESNGVPKIDFF